MKKAFAEAEIEAVELERANDVIATSGHGSSKPGVELPTDEW